MVGTPLVTRPIRVGRHRRPFRAVAHWSLAIASLALLSLPGCAGGQPPGKTAGAVREAALLPLLGTSGAAPDRPALAVKIDATASGRPQHGLSAADVVFEEVVEGGLTRFLAVFHSQDPDTVGPVRSARSTDLPVLAELGRPLFAWSGANEVFAAMVRAADLVDVGAEARPGAYRRDAERRAPYNLLADPGLLRAGAATGGAPAPLFAYRHRGQPPVGPPAVPVTGFRTLADSGLATSIEWRWDAASASWSRSQDGTTHVDASGDPIVATNVVIRFTPYTDSGMRDSSGAVVPVAVAVGEGEAVVLTGGYAQQARWQKAADASRTVFTASSGDPILLTPGPTWVEVLPPGSGAVF